MTLFPGLGTLGEANQTRRAPQKGTHPTVERQERKVSKDAQAKAFREAVWKRDERKCRATGKPLVQSGTTDPLKLGEVDHSIPRSLAPERIYDVGNGVLMQKYLNRLRKVVCKRAPEFKRFDYTGPDDRSKPQHFVWRNDDGKITKERIG